MQPKSLSPNGAILGDMIRQGEEVRVREKCGGFMLVVEGVCIAHRPFKGMCPAWAIPSRNCRKSASGMLAVVVLLLQIVLVLLACILAPYQLSHPLPQGVRHPLLPLLAQSMAALSKDQ